MYRALVQIAVSLLLSVLMASAIGCNSGGNSNTAPPDDSAKKAPGPSADTKSTAKTAGPMVLAGHAEEVTSMAFSPDGKTLASGSKDTTIILWDVQAGKKRADLKGHKGWVNTVRFSPDGKLLASGGGPEFEDGSELKIWDLSTGKEKQELKGHGKAVSTVLFSADGKSLFSGAEDGTLRVWDVESGAEKNAAKIPYQIHRLALAPDGKTLAVGLGVSEGQTLWLWDVTSGKEKGVMKGQKEHVFALAFSLDGALLASGDSTLKLWELASGKEKSTLPGHSLRVTGVAFVPGKQLLASGDMGGVARLWDTVSWKELVNQQAHQVGCNLAVSANGETLATSGVDIRQPPVTIRLWSVSGLISGASKGR